MKELLPEIRTLLSPLAPVPIVATSTVMVKKAVLKDVGGFDEQFRGPEDYDLWMSIAARSKEQGAESIAIMNAPLTYYRERAGSLSMDDRTFLPEVLRVLDKAFAEDGALSEMPHMQSKATARQYWHASLMASSRGDRGQALKYLSKSRGAVPATTLVKRMVRYIIE